MGRDAMVVMGRLAVFGGRCAFTLADDTGTGLIPTAGLEAVVDGTAAAACVVRLFAFAGTG